MLKKKSIIPPRPKPPNPDQIVEDLEHAPSDDIVFLLKKSTGHKEVTETSNKSAEPMNTEVGRPKTWDELQEFVQGNKELTNLLEQLRDKSEDLQASELELRGMAEDIRRQALNALK